MKPRYVLAPEAARSGFNLAVHQRTRQPGNGGAYTRKAYCAGVRGTHVSKITRRGAPAQKRFYDFDGWDFNVGTARKRVEKLRYMHRNPVQRGLWSRRSSGAGAASVPISWAKPDRWR